MYSTRPLNEVLKNKNNKELIFIHTPKCAGSYISNILSHLKIKNKGHNQAIQNEGITFTVIRDPIRRFESLLNYRLNEGTPRNDWPKRLSYVYINKTIQLNEVFSKMTDKEILSFLPFRTLTYWTKNVDIIITLENLPKMLEYFGYTYDINLFKPNNVSNKIRGDLNQPNRNRLKRLFKGDIALYNMVINSTFKV
jgi:hypothetical protein